MSPSSRSCSWRPTHRSPSASFSASRRVCLMHRVADSCLLVCACFSASRSHASRFIIEQLRRERPEQYQAIFKQLLQRAQVTKDDKLLSNYYLQVISIIEMNNQHNKALGTTRRISRPPAPALTTTRKG